MSQPAALRHRPQGGCKVRLYESATVLGLWAPQPVSANGGVATSSALGAPLVTAAKCGGCQGSHLEVTEGWDPGQ